MKIIEMDISARSKYALIGAGFTQVEDLRFVEDRSLFAIKNMNIDGVREIKKAVCEYFHEDTQSSYVNVDDFSIKDLDLSEDTINRLIKAGIKTVNDVRNIPLIGFEKATGLGKYGFYELVGELEELGLLFHADIEPDNENTESEAEQIINNSTGDENAVPFNDEDGRILQEQVNKILDNLTVRERTIIEYRFGLIDGKCRTLEEVANEFYITRERVRQIEAKALRKLRWPSRSKGHRDFLD